MTRTVDPRRVQDLEQAIEAKNAESVADFVAGVIDDLWDEEAEPGSYGDFLERVQEELDNHIC